MRKTAYCMRLPHIWWIHIQYAEPAHGMRRPHTVHGTAYGMRCPHTVCGHGIRVSLLVHAQENKSRARRKKKCAWAEKNRAHGPVKARAQEKKIARTENKKSAHCPLKVHAWPSKSARLTTKKCAHAGQNPTHMQAKKRAFFIFVTSSISTAPFFC